jgi:molybdenum cofactor guanylyltransferase
MGRDKAMIEIAGIPLIRRIYDAIASCQEPAAVIANPLNPFYHQISVVTPWAQRYQSVLPIDCHFIADQQPDRGPLVAFSQAISAIPSTWVFLVACDLPYLSTPRIQSWIDKLPFIPPASLAYLPRHQSKGWEPLCGFYRQTCDRSLAEYINNGGRSFQNWLTHNTVTELIIDDPSCLLNCNTPADLRAIEIDLF